MDIIVNTLRLLKSALPSLYVPDIRISYICEAYGDWGMRGKYLRKCPFLGKT